jgi:hypothetical protein
MYYLFTCVLTLSILLTLPASLQGGRPKSKELVIDLAQCKAETRVFSWAFGSERFVVKGLRNDICVVEYTKEVEGAYKKSECSFPIEVKKISVGTAEKSDAAEGGKRDHLRYSTDFSKYCKLVKSGNLLEGPPSN